ncbi:MAG: fibronectin type III domain-containing protein, partial [Huintestinicola sp.]|uniref:fibronectin type III domain-containing protein n=1 Tax=Huintestinicola sp. TaxID=2981661 RepID=UPI003F021096
MKGKKILSAVLAVSTLCMTLAPAELALTVGAYSTTTTVSLSPSEIDLLDTEWEDPGYDREVLFTDIVIDPDTDTYDVWRESQNWLFFNSDNDRAAIISAIYDQTGNYPTNLKLEDIAISYSWTYTTTVPDPELDIVPKFWTGGLDANGEYTDINGDTFYNVLGVYDPIRHNTATGSSTIKASELSTMTNTPLSEYTQMAFGMAANGLDTGDKLEFEVTSVKLTVNYDAAFVKPLSELSGDQYIDVAGTLVTKSECNHTDNRSHIDDYGNDYWSGCTYCPWRSFRIYGKKSDSTLTSAYKEYGFDGDTAAVSTLIKLSDVTDVLGSGIEALVFMTDNCAVTGVTGHATLPDADLATISINNVTIPEWLDWNSQTMQSDIPTGWPSLEQTKEIVSHSDAHQFNDYDALKLEYTIGNVDAVSAVVIILHGWGNNANVGWEMLYFAPQSSGSVVVDLSPYYNKDYYNIYAGVVAQPDAKIGDSFAPDFNITSAKLVVDSSEQATAAITPIKAYPPLPHFEAEAGDCEINLSWDPVYNIDNYKVIWIDEDDNTESRETSDISFTISDLENDKEYDVIVLAVDEDGLESKYTNADLVQVTPSAIYPSYTVDLSVITDPYITVTGKLVPIDECLDATHIGDDGNDYSQGLSYCPWSQVYIYGIKADTSRTEEYYSFKFEGDTENVSEILKLSDIKAVVGEDVTKLVLCPWSCNVTNVTGLAQLPDAVLGTVSITETSILEKMEWNSATNQSDIHTGRPELGYMEAISQNSSAHQFNNYDALKLEYTLGNTEDTAAVYFILQGWGENANVGWTGIFFKPQVDSNKKGSIVIDLEPYYNMDYYNIYVGVSAGPHAQIGDRFAPNFTVTSAKLLVNCTEKATDTIEWVQPIPPLPTVTAKAGDAKIDLSWTAVSGVSGYKVRYIDKATNSTITLSRPATETSYTIKNLVNGRTYDIIVLACYDETDSEYTSADLTHATPVAPVTPVSDPASDFVERLYVNLLGRA